jgi:hypothetical protein
MMDIEKDILGKTVSESFIKNHPEHNDQLVIKFTDGTALIVDSRPTIPDGSFVLAQLCTYLENLKGKHMSGTPHDQVDCGYYWVKETTKTFGWDFIVLFHFNIGANTPYGYTAWAPLRNQIIKGLDIPSSWYIGPKISTADFEEQE